MRERGQRVSAGRFVLVAELLDHAFPKAKATPDYLSHDAERAEQALLSSLGRGCTTRDETLAQLLALSDRDWTAQARTSAPSRSMLSLQATTCVTHAPSLSLHGTSETERQLRSRHGQERRRDRPFQ